jgi:hypothetical protein
VACACWATHAFVPMGGRAGAGRALQQAAEKFGQRVVSGRGKLMMSASAEAPSKPESKGETFQFQAEVSR